MEAKHVKDIIEAYASVYQSKESLLESNVDFGYKGGIPGIYDKNGNLVKKASELDPQQLKDLEADYIRRRGPAQIDIDKQVQQLKKQEQDKARAAAAAAADTAAQQQQQAPAAADTAAQQQQQAPAAADTAAQQQQQAPPKPTPATGAQTGNKAKDMATWAKANPRLAEVERLRAQQKSAGKSVFDKEFRTNVVNPVMYNSGGRSVEDSKKKFPASSTPAPKPVSLSVVPYKEPEEKKQLVKSSYEYDAYDLVLEYLLSQGHTDTVEEAQYVMMEMDAETIGSIVEAASDQSDKQIEKGVKTTYKAQNVLDNQHQGRSKGLNKLPRGEREEKAKRMRGRLKSRRDDLFGERNNREDEKREKLKKMLGL
jgi:hypothetical protein